MDRIVAVDLARFLAVVGMMGAHLLIGTEPEWLLAAVTGFPSSAFAVIGGISAILATRRYSADGQHLAAALSLAARGVAVAGLGLILQPIGYPVLVVLAYFGAGLVLLALLLRLPTWAMLATASVLAVGGGYLNVAVRAALGDPDSEAISIASPLRFAASLMFTGSYPVVTWLAYLLVGAAIGRMLVAHRAPSRLPGAVLTAIGGVGLVSAVAADLLSGTPSDAGDEADGAPIGSGIRFLLDTTAHSGSLGDIVRTASAAAVVLGVLLVVTRRGGRVPAALRPVRAAGAAPLTIYTLHVLFVGISTAVAISVDDPTVYSDHPHWWLGGIGIWAVNAAVAIAIGALLSFLHRRGPLEASVGTLSAWAAGFSPRMRPARDASSG